MEVRARRAHRPLRLLAPAALLFGLALLVPLAATAATVTVEVKEFDYVDVGAIIDSARSVPVVVKTLVFPVGHDSRAEMLQATVPLTAPASAS